MERNSVGEEANDASADTATKLRVLRARRESPLDGLNTAERNESRTPLGHEARLPFCLNEPPTTRTNGPGFAALSASPRVRLDHRVLQFLHVPCDLLGRRHDHGDLGIPPRFS